MSWIVSNYKKELSLKLCIPAPFYLAATGLLNDMECSTHWQADSMLSLLSSKKVAFVSSSSL